jgi:hypothetical protein
VQNRGIKRGIVSISTTVAILNNGMKWGEDG